MEKNEVRISNKDIHSIHSSNSSYKISNSRIFFSKNLIKTQRAPKYFINGFFNN